MMRILFVDDQQRELDGMTRMLNWAEMGAEVAGAVTDGRAALEIAKTQPIDVVISDVIMQNMDGLTLVRELKACRPQIKTICISGFDDFKFVSMAINNGASGYVLKPILVNEIRQVLERVFEEIRKERRLQARRQEIDRSLLALLCVGAENWCGELSEEEKDTPVRLAYGLRLPVGECLCRLDMHGGECLCLLGAGMPSPQGALVSPVIPLREAREAYLSLLGQTSKVTDEQDAVATIKQNVEKHLSEDAATETLLENVYLSSGYANALFKSATGMTIHRYVVFRRLEKAAQLLIEQPETRVKDIAWQCGFSDASHLINSFQKTYDMTPEKYRRRHAKP